MRNLTICRQCPEYYKGNQYDTHPKWKVVEEFCDAVIVEEKKEQQSVNGSLGGGIAGISGNIRFPMKKFFNLEEYIVQELPEQCPYILETIVLEDEK